MKQITRITIATIGTAALLAGGGGIALAAGQTAASASAASATATATTAAAPAAVVDISSRKAVQIARKRVPGGRVTEIEREWEHGHSVWKVELRKGGWEYDVYVSAKSGRIIKFKRDYDG
ncbi:PepSY domain-containing protein [Streptosporangium roseum]|uniref:PepSY domain-containing protein n=1 Tax=Streptosporangium roseum TaxID=2001 RepID=UPI00068934B6|nr:PepSY domain-containing protein [Streptosporangium roseum]